MNKPTPYQFFKKHAGYSYGVNETPEQGRRRTARELASAETWADAEGLMFETRYDDERAYCYCDSPDCKYHENSGHDYDTVYVLLYRPCADHGVNCKHAEVLQSLSGIIDPTEDYLRVVKAELAHEQQHQEKKP